MSTSPQRTPSYEAFQMLHVGFTVTPIIVGLDKFVNLLTDWTQYLAPSVTTLLPVSPQAFMGVVGIVEIIAGVLVWVHPRVGALVVAGWLGAIVANLVWMPGLLDIAVRDLGLALAAVALARLAREHAGQMSDTVAPQAARRAA